MKGFLKIFIGLLVCVCVVGCSNQRTLENESIKEKMMNDGWDFRLENKNMFYIEFDKTDNVFAYDFDEKILRYNDYVYTGAGFAYDIDEEVNNVITANAVKCLEEYGLLIEDIPDFMTWCKGNPTFAKESDKNYQFISLEELARNNEMYLGEDICIYGEIVNVFEKDGVAQYRISEVQSDYDFQEVTILVEYNRKSGESRFLEGDAVDIYGKYKGLQTYETALGDSKTLPFVYAEFIELW